MKDKRVIKTKKNIKNALIDLLSQMTFEKISVTEICSRGLVSRITFYTYYEDKYKLVEEMFADYIEEANQTYHALQEANNPEKNGIRAHQNLLEAILCMFYDNIAFFIHTGARENPYLYSAYFNCVYCAVLDYLQRHNAIQPKYPFAETAALICNGMFGVINTSIAEKKPEAEVRKIARSIYLDLLRSEIFTK